MTEQNSRRHSGTQRTVSTASVVRSDILALRDRQGPSGEVASRPGVSGAAGFQPLCGADALTRCVALFYELGCQRVVFTLRSHRRHGAVHTLHYPQTGEIAITKVRLHREASMPDICHEVGHVLDAVLQKEHPSGGSLSPEFAAHLPALRAIADYTCVDYVGGSPRIRSPVVFATQPGEVST